MLLHYVGFVFLISAVQGYASWLFCILFVPVLFCLGLSVCLFLVFTFICGLGFLYRFYCSVVLLCVCFGGLWVVWGFVGFDLFVGLFIVGFILCFCFMFLFCLCCLYLFVLHGLCGEWCGFWLFGVVYLCLVLEWLGGLFGVLFPVVCGFVTTLVFWLGLYLGGFRFAWVMFRVRVYSCLLLVCGILFPLRFWVF